jgi:ribonuclease HI
MTGWLPGWIGKKFHGVKNADMIKHLLVLLRRRSIHNKVVFKYVAGHSGEIGNEAADVSLVWDLHFWILLIKTRVWQEEGP